MERLVAERAQTIMKKAVLATMAASLVLMAATARGEEFNGHSAYKVTSYDLSSLFSGNNEETPRYFVDFKPLMITSNVADILDSEHFTNVSLGKSRPDSATEGIALSATFDATRKISVQGAFGVTRNHWSPNTLNFESESSWEANLGVIYKLLDHLSYELHFGYMDTGTLFTDRSSYTNVESIIMVSNQLTMSF